MDKDAKELLTKIRHRYKVMVEADDDNRKNAEESFRFVNVYGHQWDDVSKKERRDRPCYEFNRLRISAKRVINEMRANRPAGKVRGTEGGDKETAEVFEGLIRNIWAVSDGDTVMDYAAEYQVGAGMGAWRVTTDYADDSAFDQDIRIEAIPNPLCLYSDPSCKDPLKRDADDWILTERISKKEFETAYPNAEKVDFEDTEFDDDADWWAENGEEVRVAEYWYKVPATKEIWQLQDGKVIDASTDEAQAMDPAQIRRKRTVKTHKVMMCIASGDSILEDPTEWAGKHHPFVVAYGEYMIVDGKPVWYGISEFSKDAQRSYNFSRTAIAETIAMAPQAKFWATTDQAKGHAKDWAMAHKENLPVQIYTADPKAPGPPQRMGGADVPIALIQESQLASAEIDATTGIYQDDRGQQSDSQSGRAIYARQDQGRIATFNYLDNMGKAIQRTWEILVDLVPKIYDTERELRILGSDGAEDYARINTFAFDEAGNQIKVNDLSAGKYDVTITIGPSFSTRRQEAVEAYQGLLQGNPNLFPIIGDLVMKSMDLPYSEDIAARLKALLPPEIKALEEDVSQSPEVQAAMQQANQAMQMVDMRMQEIQAAAQQIQQDQAQTERGKAELEKMVADLKTQEAKFSEKVAKELAKIAQKEYALQIQAMEQANTEERDDLQEGRALLGQTVAASIDAINEMARQFAEQAAQTLMEVRATKEAPRPKVVRIDSKRENGRLVAIPVYETEPGGTGAELRE